MMNFKYKIQCDAKKIDFSYINMLCDKYNPKEILLEFPNTKNMDISILKKLNPNVSIRIADGYTEAKMNGAKRADDYFERSVYTRDEVIQIVKKIEEIEKGIHNDWNDIQKVVYIYDLLRRQIKYNYNRKEASINIRSLRVLLSDSGVCAGYATVFKDLMDRQGIKCEYISGNGHAWNIVTIDGKIYPVDVTWGHGRFAEGKHDNYDFLGQNKTMFNQKHIPDSKDPNKGYQSKLSTINKKIIEKLSIINAVEKNYESTTYYYTRNDKTKFIVSQIGQQVIDGETYYRYCYTELNPDNTKKAPIILYSETNLALIELSKRKKNHMPKGYEENVINVLFSKKNIRDSIYNKYTNYIGKITYKNEVGKTTMATKPEEIIKEQKMCIKFNNQTKTYYRGEKYISPGLVVQKMSEKPLEVEGIKVYYYDIFEYVDINGKKVLKRNRVFTEDDIFEIKNQILINLLLSRDRLDRKAKETGGYIGKILPDGRRLNNRKLIDYFKSPSGKGKTNSELLDILEQKENRTEFNSKIKLR